MAAVVGGADGGLDWLSRRRLAPCLTSSGTPSAAPLDQERARRSATVGFLPSCRHHVRPADTRVGNRERCTPMSSTVASIWDPPPALARRRLRDRIVMPPHGPHYGEDNAASERMIA